MASATLWVALTGTKLSSEGRWVASSGSYTCSPASPSLSPRPWPSPVSQSELYPSPSLKPGAPATLRAPIFLCRPPHLLLPEPLRPRMMRTRTKRFITASSPIAPTRIHWATRVAPTHVSTQASLAPFPLWVLWRPNTAASSVGITHSQALMSLLPP